MASVTSRFFRPDLVLLLAALTTPAAAQYQEYVNRAQARADAAMKRERPEAAAASLGRALHHLAWFTKEDPKQANAIMERLKGVDPLAERRQKAEDKVFAAYLDLADRYCGMGWSRTAAAVLAGQVAYGTRPFLARLAAILEKQPPPADAIAFRDFLDAKPVPGVVFTGKNMEWHGTADEGRIQFSRKKIAGDFTVSCQCRFGLGNFETVTFHFYDHQANGKRIYYSATLCRNTDTACAYIHRSDGTRKEALACGAIPLSFLTACSWTRMEVQVQGGTIRLRWHDYPVVSAPVPAGHRQGNAGFAIWRRQTGRPVGFRHLRFSGGGAQDKPGGASFETRLTAVEKAAKAGGAEGVYGEFQELLRLVGEVKPKDRRIAGKRALTALKKEAFPLQDLQLRTDRMAATQWRILGKAYLKKGWVATAQAILARSEAIEAKEVDRLLASHYRRQGAAKPQKLAGAELFKEGITYPADKSWNLEGDSLRSPAGADRALKTGITFHRDFRVTVELRADSRDAAAGILWSASQLEYWCGCEVVVSRGNLVINVVDVIDDSLCCRAYMIIGSTTAILRQWNRLEMVRRNGRMTITFADRYVLHFPVAPGDQPGPFGLWVPVHSGNSGPTCFRNLVYQEF